MLQTHKLPKYEPNMTALSSFKTVNCNYEVVAMILEASWAMANLTNFVALHVKLKEEERMREREYITENSSIQSHEHTKRCVRCLKCKRKEKKKKKSTQQCRNIEALTRNHK